MPLAHILTARGEAYLILIGDVVDADRCHAERSTFATVVGCLVFVELGYEDCSVIHHAACHVECRHTAFGGSTCALHRRVTILAPLDEVAAYFRQAMKQVRCQRNRVFLRCEVKVVSRNPSIVARCPCRVDYHVDAALYLVFHSIHRSRGIVGDGVIGRVVVACEVAGNLQRAVGCIACL